MSLKHYWESLQDFLDVKGDVVMLAYTAAIIYKTLYHGLNPSDAAAYASAVGALGYSKGQKCKRENSNPNSEN